MAARRGKKGGAGATTLSEEINALLGVGAPGREQSGEEEDADMTAARIDSDVDLDYEEEPRGAQQGRSALRTAAEAPLLDPRLGGTEVASRASVLGHSSLDNDESDGEGDDESEGEGDDDGDEEDEELSRMLLEGVVEENNEEEDEAPQSDEEVITQATAQADALERQLRQEEKEEEAEGQGVALVALPSAQEELQKAAQTKHQVVLWDAMLDLRIRMQPLLALANRMPPAGVASALASDPALAVPQDTRDALAAGLAGAAEAAQALADDLHELGALVWDRCEQVVAEAGGKYRRDEGPDARSARYAPYARSVVERWHERTQVGASAAHRFKALDTSPLAQAERLLAADMDRLVGRTRVRRTEGQRLCWRSDSGSGSGSEEKEQAQAQEEDVFDDTDFYGDLLRELVESAGKQQGQAGDGIGAELSAVRRKQRKQHARGASKGRTLSFEVQAPLVGFMAPVDPPGLADWDTERLFSSLFGGSSAPAGTAGPDSQQQQQEEATA
eukprot:m51a1_g11207 putative protein aatf-like (503) ;mRNA; r:33867-35559